MKEKICIRTSVGNGDILKLVNGEILAVRIPNVYTPEELGVCISNIKKRGIDWYPNFELRQGRIGICATEYASKINGKEAYFLLKEEAQKVRKALFPGDLDPVKRFLELLPVDESSVARDGAETGDEYFAGLIRAMMHESTTHYDYAPTQLPGWAVANAEAQFAMVAYLNVPSSGGGITLYNYKYQPQHESYNKDCEEKGPKGFDSSFLNDVEHLTLTPSAGEVIIFNSQYFHRVESIPSPTDIRLSVNSFFTVQSGKVLLWN